ncbi:MAG: type II toxin-antitoxin system prevent-host-death family antitoxin [Patescibacteria group bacterium]
MNKIIGLKELRENTENYISQVQKGRSFTVVRRSQPIFTITPVDEWGDEGNWKTVTDLTKINKKGASLSVILSSLKRLNAQDR